MLLLLSLTIVELTGGRQNILPHTRLFLFTLCVAIFDIAEGLVSGLTGSLGPMGVVEDIKNGFNHEWISRALV